MQLWYCNACTRLINPPGSEGTLGPDGNRYCAKCAPAKKQTPPTGEPTKQGSRSVIPAVKPHPEPHGTRVAAQHTPAHGAAAKPNSSVLAFGLGGAAIFVVAALIYVFSGGNSESKVASSSGSPSQPNSTQNPTPTPATPRTSTTNDPPMKGGAQPPTGGLFSNLNLGGGDTARKEPAGAHPPDAGAAPKPPETGTPAPVAAPAPAAPASALTIDAFTKDIVSARELGNKLRYSDALAALKSARDRYGAAEWFGAQQKNVSDLEARVQQQLAEFTMELDDLRTRAQKSESLEFLTTTEREWAERLKAMTGGEPPLWILMEPTKIESSGGATMTLQPGGSILASGNNPPQDIHTITTRIQRRDITAVRIEALPHGSFVNSGPGRAGNGNVALAKMRVLVKEESSPDPPQQLALTNPSYDFAQGNCSPLHVTDEDPNTHWAFIEQVGRPHAFIAQATGIPTGTGPLLMSVVLEYNSPHHQHVIGHVRCSYTIANPPPAGTDPRALAVPEVYTADPLALKPITQLFKQISERRVVLLQAQETKKIAELTTQLDGVERQVRGRPSRIDALMKGLETLEAQLPERQDAALPLLERIAQLRFDTLSAKDGELSLFDANVRSMGGGAELAYDFADVDQYNAWTGDIPNGGGGISYDAKAGNVRLQVLNKRNWDNEDRRNAPIYWLPFLFDQNNWVFEAGLTLVDDKRPGSKTHMGILMWDGKYSARLFIRENSAKDVALQLAHCHPNQNVVTRAATIPGTIRDTYFLNMTCMNGQVAFSVRNAAGKVAALPVGKEKLNFEPKYFGVFLRSDDDGEIATATIDNVRFTGQPLKDKLKEAHQARRLTYVQRYREEWLRQKTIPGLEQAERAGTLGNQWFKLWRQSGGASVGRHNDRDNVWISHPGAVGQPFVWRRKVTLESGKNWMLRFDVSGAQDYQLVIKVNDQEVLSKVISGRGWQAIEVPLAKYAGGPVNIEILNQCGGTNHWSEEYSHWDNVRITPQ